MSRTRSYNTFMPPRPLEGRISRLIGPNQMVRCVIKDGRIQYVPYVPKIVLEMDKVREHSNLPSQAHDSFQRPSDMAQWKRIQSMQPPETRLEKHRQQTTDAQSLILSGDTRKEAYDSEPRNYLKAMAELHKKDLKQLTEGARWKEAELREHKHDLNLLRRKVDYTSPQMQPPVYYDTLHKIYTAKVPFYYDGDNPYEYDYVLPWDNIKTNTILDDYKREAERMEKEQKASSGKNNDYQFNGSPGVNPFIASKNTTLEQWNISPTVNNIAHPSMQDIPSQSIYTHSYSPDKVRQVDAPLDMSALQRSLPASMGEGGYCSHSSTIDSTKLKHPAESNYDLSNSNPNTTSASSKPLYDPAYRHPHSNPVVDARHSNPEPSNDFRFGWTSSYPYGERPQTTLLKMQNSFTKSNTRKALHVTFPETNPDLRDHIGSGKKHEFQGENSYYWH